VASSGIFSTNKCAGIVTGSYISERNRSINSKWTIFGLCHDCIHWAMRKFSAQTV